MGKNFILLLALISFNNLLNAQDLFDKYKIDYDRLRKQEKHDSALVVAKQMSAWAFQNETDTSLRYAVSLRYVGNCFFSIEELDSTIFYWQKSYAFFDKFHQLNIEFIRTLNNIGVYYQEIKEDQKAEPYYLKASQILLKLLGENHPDFIENLGMLARFYYDKGDLKNAEDKIQHCIQLQKNNSNRDTSDFLDNCTLLAGIYRITGRINDAIILQRSVSTSSKDFYGQNDPKYATALNNLGVLYDTYGDYASAKSYFIQALEIRKLFFSKLNLDYTESLNDLGGLYSTIGDYKTAEQFYMNAFTLRKKFLEKENQEEYVESINSLGVFYYELGNLFMALKYFKNALELRKQILGEKDPDYAMSLYNLALVYVDMDSLDAALKYCKQSSDIYLNHYGADNFEIATNYDLIGTIYYNNKELDSAEYYYFLALKLRENYFGKEHTEYAHVLHNLGLLYLDKKDFSMSEQYFKMANNIIRQSLGVNNFTFMDNVSNLIGLYYQTEDYIKANEVITNLLDIKTNYLNANFLWMNNAEKEIYWKKEIKLFDNVHILSAKANKKEPLTIDNSYNSCLISKSLLLETSRELDQAIAQSPDVEMKAEFAEMKQFRKLFSKMQSEGSVNKEIMEHYKTQADSLDKILVNKIGEHTASNQKFKITWKDVQSNLTTTDAAIEFARYFDDKDSLYKYLALLVRPDYEYPKLVILGEEEQIRSAVGSKDFAALYGLVWQEIDSLLTGVKTVYYSPVGELNNVAFSALCSNASESQLAVNDNQSNRGVVIQSEKGAAQSCNSVLMDRYALHQLTTTRYLADGTLNKENSMQKTLTLFGGINLDDVPKYQQTEDKEQSNEDFALQAYLSNRSASTNTNKRAKRSSSNYREKMKYLEGTKEEVTNIAGLMTNSNWQVQTRSEKRAGEHEFKKEMETKSPGVLHIATHGFAFPDKVEKKSKQLDMNQTSIHEVSEDPMVRCGLMLSGSNISWTGNPQKMIEQTGDDGILTAAEVANLDLSNTKLVVLSACETGLGKIEGSEGTFGLKRGFKLAGVEQMIVSLWSVPDKETMELMTLFYSDLTKTLNPVASFAKAQKEMRNRYPTEPDKWAGFVLVR